MRIVQIVESLHLGSLERLVVNLAIEQRRRRDVPEVYYVCLWGSLADESEVKTILSRRGAQ